MRAIRSAALHLVILHLAAAAAASDTIAFWDFNSLVAGESGGSNWAKAANASVGPGWLATDCDLDYVTNYQGVTGRALAVLEGPLLEGGLLGNVGRSVTLQVDTTGYRNIVLSFATQKSTYGFNRNLVQHADVSGWSDAGVSGEANPYDPPLSADGGSSAFRTFTFSLEAAARLNNNADAQLRIVFGLTGDGFWNSNNRIDNLAVLGDAIGTASLLWRNGATGQNTLWLLDGPSLRCVDQLPGADANWQVAGLADFSGDQAPDILWRHGATGQNVLWLTNGRLVRKTAWLYSAGLDWQVAGAGDFDGNGQPDILWRNQATGQNVLWFLNASGVSQVGSLYDASPAWEVAGVADFSGDGKADILWRNDATGQNVLWLMSGSTLLQVASLYGADLSWRVAGVADFDGDDDADILWRNQATGRNLLWLMGGSILHRAVSLYGASAEWQVAGVADVDGNGRADILWRNTVTGTNTLWLINGSGVSQVVGLPTAGPAWEAAGLSEALGG